MKKRGGISSRPLCHECKDAVKAVSRIGDASEKQGEQQDPVSPIGGKTVALGIDDNDPNVQLANIIVELEDGCIEHVQINDDESAEEVAKLVCQKNDFPDQFVALLAEHIIYRYPQRPVDKQKKEVTVKSEETNEVKIVKSQSESSK